MLQALKINVDNCKVLHKERNNLNCRHRAPDYLQTPEPCYQQLEENHCAKRRSRNVIVWVKGQVAVLKMLPWHHQISCLKLGGASGEVSAPTVWQTTSERTICTTCWFWGPEQSKIVLLEGHKENTFAGTPSSSLASQEQMVTLGPHMVPIHKTALGKPPPRECCRGCLRLWLFVPWV